MRKIYSNARVYLHDLSMPRVLRSRGGFGTHWMYPEFVRVMNPQIAALPSVWSQTFAQYSRLERYWVTIDKKQMFEMQRALYDKDELFCDKKWPVERDQARDLSTISDWICGRIDGQPRTLAADGQPEAWANLVRAMQSGRSGAGKASPPKR